MVTKGAYVTTPTDPADLGLPYPSWRDYQRETIDWVASNPARWLFLIAPTGTGKSPIPAALSKLGQAPVMVLTHTKQLQDQYLTLGAKTAKGRGNFKSTAYPFPGADAAPCLWKKQCCKSGNCPYTAQRDAANTADFKVLNYSYAAQAARPDYENRAGLFTNNEWLVCDEGHMMDDSVGEACSIRPPYVARYMDFPQSYKALDWVIWARATKRNVPNPATLDDPKEAAQAYRIHAYLNQVNGIGHDWVLVVKEDRAFRNGLPTWRPVWPHSQVVKKFSPLANKTLIMSATLNAPMLADLMELPDGSWDALEVPSPIPPSMRPLVYKPITFVGQKTSSEGWEKLLSAVDELLDHHANQKGLIHTVSFRLTEWLRRNSRHANRFITHSTGKTGITREEAIAQFRDSTHPVVLVSPSVDTGLDLPYMVDFNVILKVPFPDISDEIVSAQKAENPEYYKQRTADKLVQAYGRASRTEDDRGVTYILDSSFGDFYKRNVAKFPMFFREVVKV